MNVHLKHIICVFFIVSAALAAKAQGSIDIEKSLDTFLARYEQSCEDCLNLRERVDSGEKISKDQAEYMVQSFLNLHRLLKGMEPELNSRQKVRFDAIGSWFKTGEKPAVLDHEPLKRASVRLPEARAFALSENCILKRPADPSYDRPASHTERTVYIMPALTMYPASYGLMAGVKMNRWGGYARFTGSFNGTVPSYSCSDDGTLENGGSIWPNGKSAGKTLQITTGALYEMNGHLDVYGGLGYGRHQSLLQDIDGNWAAAGSGISGICLEAGVLASWKSVTFGAGLSSISFRSLTPVISIGINF